VRYLEPLAMVAVLLTALLACKSRSTTNAATIDGGAGPAPSASAKPVDVDGILGRHRAKIAPIVADVDKLLKTKFPPHPAKNAATADGLVYKGEGNLASNATVVKLTDTAWPGKLDPFSTCKEGLDKRYVVEIYGEQKFEECERVRYIVLYRIYNHKPGALTGGTERGYRAYQPGSQDVDVFVYAVRGAKALGSFTYHATNSDTLQVSKGETPDFEIDLSVHTDQGLAIMMKSVAKATAFEM
jgi:hypothetical protein